MIFSFFRKIIKEDFAKDNQDLVGRLGFIINPCFQQLATMMSHNLNWTDNFACNVKSVSITVDGTGKPINATSFSVDLVSPCQHLIVTRAINTNSSTTFPTTAPFVSWTQNNSSIVINNVTGLQASTPYTLTIIVTI